MKLSDWARQQGVSYKTAHRWFHAGTLPVPSEQLPSGTILVHLPSETSGDVVVYARVSSSDRRDDLDGQVGRVVSSLTEHGLQPARVVTEVGSAMNGARPKLKRLLADPSVATIAVEHRDRLARFGFDYIEAALVSQGRRIMVIDDRELEDDLVRDMTEVLTSFCARLYGRRSARRRATKAAEAAAVA